MLRPIKLVPYEVLYYRCPKCHKLSNEQAIQQEVRGTKYLVCQHCGKSYLKAKFRVKHSYDYKLRCGYCGSLVEDEPENWESWPSAEVWCPKCGNVIGYSTKAPKSHEWG